MLLFNMLKKLYVCVCVRVRESVKINDRRRCSSFRTLEDRKKRLSSCLSQTSIVSDISVLISVFNVTHLHFKHAFSHLIMTPKTFQMCPQDCLKRFYVLYFYLILCVSFIVSGCQSVWHKSWIVAQIFRSKRQ